MALFLPLLGSGCNWLSGPIITVEWKSPKEGLVPKTHVQYESEIVGDVTAAKVYPSGSFATVRLYKAKAHFVRTKSDFLFHRASGARSAFIELVVLDKDSPPTADGAHFQASDGNTEIAIKWLTTDWKRTAILLAVIMVVVLVTVYVVRLVLKLWAVAASLALAAASAVYFGPFWDRLFAPMLPPGTRADLIGYAAAFAIGIIAASLLLGILLKPLRTTTGSA